MKEKYDRRRFEDSIDEIRKIKSIAVKKRKLEDTLIE